MNTAPRRAMRDVFIEKIYEKMGEDERIFFLSADFGAPSLDKLRTDFSDRYINVGIAEQNLINIATGLALEGNTVYAYLISPFVMRAYEQIRVNLAMSSQMRPVNVNIIAVGVGLGYEVSGPTHHCLEDISIMKLLPNIELFSPSDSVMVQHYVDRSIEVKMPKYLRFDGKPLPLIYNDTNSIDFNKGFCELKEGKDTCLVSTGFKTHTALATAEMLLKENVHIGVVDVFLLKPINTDNLYDCLKKYKNIITIEEAFVDGGGLDSTVLNIVSERSNAIKVKRLGFESRYVFDLGSRNYLHKLNNLDEESIIKHIKSFK